MGGRKTKLIFMLIVYFAGFATAIYCLVPVPESYAELGGEKSFVDSVFKSDEFAQSFSAGMHKCIDFAKGVAWRAGGYLKQKLGDRHQNETSKQQRS